MSPGRRGGAPWAGSPRLWGLRTITKALSLHRKCCVCAPCCSPSPVCFPLGPVSSAGHSWWGRDGKGGKGHRHTLRRPLSVSWQTHAPWLIPSLLVLLLTLLFLHLLWVGLVICPPTHVRSPLCLPDCTWGQQSHSQSLSHLAPSSLPGVHQIQGQLLPGLHRVRAWLRLVPEAGKSFLPRWSFPLAHLPGWTPSLCLWNCGHPGPSPAPFLVGQEQSRVKGCLTHRETGRPDTVLEANQTVRLC